MLRSEVEFGAFLAYSPRGNDDAAIASQDWVRKLKGNWMVAEPRRAASSFVVQRLRARFAETGLDEILGPDVLLVPAPASGLSKPGSLWVPRALAESLVAAGLGRATVECLRRVKAIRKASTSPADQRPSALEHFESMRVTSLPLGGARVVVVDDVVTRGATLLAAISRIQELVPNTSVRGFAIVRTISEPDRFERMFAPCVGRIVLRDDGSTTRRP